MSPSFARGPLWASSSASSDGCCAARCAAGAGRLFGVHQHLNQLCKPKLGRIAAIFKGKRKQMPQCLTDRASRLSCRALRRSCAWAPLAELVDALDSKSSFPRKCRFDSGGGHHLQPVRKIAKIFDPRDQISAENAPAGAAPNIPSF